eukprot:1088035-Prorocentrum_minimum.AAC.2
MGHHIICVPWLVATISAISSSKYYNPLYFFLVLFLCGILFIYKHQYSARSIISFVPLASRLHGGVSSRGDAMVSAAPGIPVGLPGIPAGPVPLAIVLEYKRRLSCAILCCNKTEAVRWRTRA